MLTGYCHKAFEPLDVAYAIIQLSIMTSRPVSAVVPPLCYYYSRIRILEPDIHLYPVGGVRGEKIRRAIISSAVCS